MWHAPHLYQTGKGDLLAEPLALLFRFCAEPVLDLLDALWPQPRPVWAWLPLTLGAFTVLIFVLARLPARGAPQQRDPRNATQQH